jgi:hypothetical protein
LDHIPHLNVGENIYSYPAIRTYPNHVKSAIYLKVNILHSKPLKNMMIERHIQKKDVKVLKI